MNTMRLPAHSAMAFSLLFLLAGTCSAQGLTQRIYKSPSGESVQFLGDSVSLKYFPAASANCSQCFLSFKLGALSELDAFGQPVTAHTVPDLSNLVPEVTGGQRMSGSVSYHYVTMTFMPERLPAALNKNNCPSLESIINQAYSAGLGPHDNDLIARFSDDAAAQHRHATVHLVGQAAPELAQMSPFGRRLQQFGRWLPRIQLTPIPSPSVQSPPPPSPPPAPSPAAPTPSPETKPAEPSSDKPAAGDSKAAADKPAEQQQPSDKVDIVSTRKPADEQQEQKQEETKQEQKQEEPKQEKQEEQKQEEPKQEEPKQEKQKEQEEQTQEEPKQEQQEEQQQQQVAAEAPPSSPPSEQVAAPVAIQPPTTDQLLGPHKKADEPAADKPAPQEAPKPAAPAAAGKPAEAKPATPAADAPKAPADQAPAPTTPDPAKEKQPQAAPGTIPIPSEKDENDGADSSGEEKPAEPPAPAAAASPAPAAVPGVLGPSVPASQAADLWRQQQEQQQQAADSIHQQLAAHGGYLVPTPPAAPAGQAWGAYPGGNAVPGVGFPAGGGDFGDAPPQFKVTFMFGFSHNKTFAYGRGRVVSAPAGSIKYTVEAQNWPFCSLYNSLKLEVVMASTVKEAQPQFVLSEAADVFEDMDSMRGPATRKLHQSVPMGNSEAFTDWMDTDKIVSKKAAVGMGGLGAGGLDMLGMSSGPVKSVSTAKLLVGPNLAAATEFPTYAFSSDRFTSESNVSVVLATSRDAARFSLTFRYFEQGLFYDPTMFFTHKDDMMVAGADVLPSVPTATLCKNETECVRGRRRAAGQGNGGSRPGAALCLRSLASAAAVLLAMLLL